MRDRNKTLLWLSNARATGVAAMIDELVAECEDTARPPADAHGLSKEFDRIEHGRERRHGAASGRAACKFLVPADKDFRARCLKCGGPGRAGGNYQTYVSDPNIASAVLPVPP